MSQTNPPSDSNPQRVGWYYIHDDAPVGPLSDTDLLKAANLGQVTPDTLVWRHDFENWIEAAQVPLLTKSLVFRAAVKRALLNAKPTQSKTDLVPKETPSAENTEPVASKPVAEEVPLDQELGDAVGDDELSEAVVDAQQVREILQRTSYYPTERTIPPASYTTPPPVQLDQRPRIARFPKLSLFVGAGVLSVAATTLLILRTNRDELVIDYATEPTAEYRAQAQSSAISSPGSAQLKTAISASETTLSANPTTNTIPALPNDSFVTIESGSLEPSLLRNKLERARPVFDAQCWSRYRVPGRQSPKNPSIEVTLSVDHLGNVYDVDTTKAPPSFRGAGLCIIGRIRGWKFPPADRSSRATITVSRFAP
jgi:hypothetical protein